MCCAFSTESAATPAGCSDGRRPTLDGVNEVEECIISDVMAVTLKATTLSVRTFDDFISRAVL